ncbi:MAG: hypothetical protein NUV46_02265 [Nanoarchaeota archaeon]|nr:hypothetical protein [Nanoarchaeota archaeon]
MDVIYFYNREYGGYKVKRSDNPSEEVLGKNILDVVDDIRIHRDSINKFEFSEFEEREKKSLTRLIVDLKTILKK